MTSNDEQRIARARWGLLRAALRGTQPDECDRRASIHCFPGFQLLSRQIVVNKEDPLYMQQLLSQQVDNNDDDDDMESFLWAIHSCQDDVKTTIVKLQCVLLSEQVRHKLAAKGILCRHTTTSSSSSGAEEQQQQQQQQQLCVVWLPPNTEYACVDYQLAFHEKSLRIRERLPHSCSKIKLKDLTSQQHYDGVDNTGNTRVWDSELTLTYCLLHEQSVFLSIWNIKSLWDLSCCSEQQPLRILELGAGMAGLAGMALAVQNPKNTHVVLTDGHPDAVLNNRINIHLTRALYYPEILLDITSKRLIWTTTTTNDDVTNSNTDLFDLILASDCTHFQEFHACLALTTAYRLRVGGVALFCQPPRGDSLQKFVNLCNNSFHGLWELHWLKEVDFSEKLSRLHCRYQQQQQQFPAYYDPNIHCPHFLLLRKQRSVEEADRRAVLQHMEERDG